MNLTYTEADESDIMPIFQMAKELIDTYEDLQCIDYQKVIAWMQNKIKDHIREYGCVIYQGKKAAYYRLHPEGNQIELDDLYVLQPYRNMGIGSAILQKCLRETAIPVYLYVFSGNVGAIALYSRFGFQMTKKVGITRAIMEWIPPENRETDFPEPRRKQL